MHKLLVLVILLMTLGVFGTQDVFACSFPNVGPISLDTILENTDIVVRATVVDEDDAGQNAVLHVESYLKGSGSQFVVLYRLNPILTANLMLGRSTSCAYLTRERGQGRTGIFFLDRLENGTYDYFYVYRDFEHLEHFYVRILPTGNDDPENLVSVEINETQFTDLVAEKLGTAAVEPERTPYPLLTPLKIFTEDGTEYMLPIDGQPPVQLPTEATINGYNFLYRYVTYVCEEQGCTPVLSPTATSFGVQTDPNTIQFDYPAGRTGPSWTIDFEGQGFLFSPTGDGVAVWNENILQVFVIYHVPFQGLSFDGPNNFDRQVSLTTTDNESFVDRAVWHPDGLQFAYTDADGLWLWDAYSADSVPELIAPSYENGVIPYAQTFSPGGRYLVYTYDGGNTFWMRDLISGLQHYISGVFAFSEDERQLIAAETLSVDNVNHHHIILCSLPRPTLQGFGGCGLVVSFDTVAVQIRQIIWLHQSTYLAVICTSDDNDDCMVNRYYTNRNYIGDNQLGQGEPGYFFAYEPEQDILAVVVDSDTITIDEQVYDLADVLDSPITHIEWMPSLFYHEP